MEHPFIDPKNLSELSLDELQNNISTLSSKLTFAYRSQNSAMIHQLNMVIETYRNVYQKKMEEVFNKQNLSGQIKIK